MSSGNTSSKKVLLRTFEDWGRWDEEFQTKSISLHLWNCINPDSDEALMEKPGRPAFESYNRKIPPRATDPEHLSQQGRQTRHSGQSSQTISQSSTGDPATSITETTDPQLRARNLSELTADDKASFTFEWRVYEQDYKEYKEQETNSEKLKAWVIDTVDYGLRQSSCRAIWDLRTWYSNLRTSVGATEREQQTAARRKYQAATTTLTRVPKDFAGWITSWEMATNHALVRKTGGVEDPNTWFDDLTKAIQPILGSWVTIYAGIYKDKLEEKSLTIGEVAKDLRKEAERRDLLGFQEKGSQVTRGVFGPTFAAVPETTAQPDAVPNNEGSSTHTQDQSNSRKRKRTATTGSTGVVCKACDGIHALEKCYYVFPKNAPEYFKGRKLIRDAVEHRLKNDASLKEEINRIKKVKQLEGAD
ncbi:hypothetical protein CDEST_01286 [Colletotrichum destructivum]|uniref:Gag protein n=1 Tax=Colletotrichum destructivum TaxID=34406 RepID=A0AAX4HYM7_9PEZI|nr:hypothetical protein CDEST_01286 [Colletotrichum destructivum]